MKPADVEHDNSPRSSDVANPQKLKVRLYRALLLVLGVWMALCSGTLYAFSAWEVELMDRCHLSARELDTVYASGQVGVGLGIIPGLIRDRRGPGAACLYAFVLLSLGNIGFGLAITYDGCGGLPALCSTYLVLQQGSVALYNAGLFSNQKAAPDAWSGMIAGTVAAGFGLSAAMWTAAYASVFEEDLGHYLRGTTLVFAVTALSTMVAVPRLLDGIMEEADHASVNYEGLPLKWGTPRQEADSAGKVPSTVIGAHQSTDELGVAETPPAGSERSRGSSPGDSKVEASSLACSDGRGGSPGKLAAPHLSIGEVMRSPDLWNTVVTFSLLQAIGSGIFIANVALMAESFGAPRSQRLFYVRGISYCSCAGRLAAGALLDFCEPRGLPRGAHFAWTACIFFLATVSLSWAADPLMHTVLAVASILIGFAYGANWAIMPSFLKTRFGEEHLGVTHNVHAGVMSVVVAMIANVVGGLYDRAAAAGSLAHGAGASEHCTGAHCWRGAYTLGTVLSALGALGALSLAWRLVRARRIEPGIG